MLAGRQPGLEEVLLGHPPQLVQPLPARRARGPPLEIVVGPAPPQPEGATERGRGQVGLAGRRQLASLVDEPLEADGVEVVAVHDQPVAAAGRLDRGRAELAAHAHHAALHHLRPRGRHVLAPQGVGQQVRRHRLSLPQCQRRQHHPVPRTEARSVPIDLQWTEEPDTHRPAVSTSARSGSIGLLPR